MMQVRRQSIKGMMRAAMIVMAAAAAIWLSAAVTITLIWGVSSPTRALSLWAVGAESRASLASDLLRRGHSAEERRRARDLAQGALEREPVNVAAARTLGLVSTYESNLPQAERLFQYAESISRRDAPTQLWLIENSVAKNDIPSALRHYDRALRTSPNTRALLFPVLLQASVDPAIASQLAKLLARRPPWSREFAFLLAEKGEDPATLAALVESLRLVPAEAGDRQVLVNVIGRLHGLGDDRRAYELYRSAAGGSEGKAGLVRNGRFEEPDQLPPFDWALVEQPGLAAVKQPKGNAADDQALFLFAGSGRTGEVARQLLILPPGDYRLRAVIGGTSGDALSRPLVSLICASKQPQLIAAIRLPRAAAGGMSFAHGGISVPPTCSAQWLTITISSTLDDPTASSWIDDISVSRIQ